MNASFTKILREVLLDSIIMEPYRRRCRDKVDLHLGAIEQTNARIRERKRERERERDMQKSTNNININIRINEGTYA